MTSAIRNSVVVAAAMGTATAVAGVLSADPRIAVVWTATIIVVEALGIGIRAVGGGRSRRPVLVGVLQLLVVCLATQAAAGWLSGQSTSPTVVIDLFDRAREVVQAGAPAAADDAVLVVSAAVIGLLTVLTDLLFIGLGTVVAAMLSVAVPFLTAVAVSPRPVAAGAFVVLAVGWALLGWSRTLDHDRRWPRRVPDTDHHWVGFSLWGVILTAGAVAGALLVGLMVSPVERDLFPGTTAQASVELVDPIVPMDQALKRPEDTPVLTYTSSAERGVMLRQATLAQVDAQGWHLVDVDLLSGEPGSIPGVASTRITDTTSVQLVDLDTQYLPVPYAPRRWTASAGLWRYDPLSLTVVDVSIDPDTTGLSYEVAHTDVEPTREALLAASAGQLSGDDPAQAAPEAIPSEISALAREITAATTTDGQAAVALQSWLRDDARFSYDLTVSPSVSYDSLVAFLTETHRGYCVHYATAMALMARSLGIGSRVAVGFTTGERGADGTWEVSAHDAHAWPELYFEDLGWVRFEPTVSVGDDPAWSTDVAIPAPTPTPSAQPSSEPTPTPQSTPTPEATDPATTPAPVPVPADGAPGLVDLPWGWLAGVLGAVAIAVIPRTVRTLVRRRRLSGTGADLVEAALTEVRASARDLGIDWGRGTLQQLADHGWDLEPSAMTALRRILLTAQQQRFSAHAPQTEHLVEDVGTVRAAWTARADARHRFLATWWPVSLWHRDGRAS